MRHLGEHGAIEVQIPLNPHRTTGLQTVSAPTTETSAPSKAPDKAPHAYKSAYKPAETPLKKSIQESQLLEQDELHTATPAIIAKNEGKPPAGVSASVPLHKPLNKAESSLLEVLRKKRESTISRQKQSAPSQRKNSYNLKSSSRKAPMVMHDNRDLAMVTSSEQLSLQGAHQSMQLQQQQ